MSQEYDDFLLIIMYSIYLRKKKDHFSLVCIFVINYIREGDGQKRKGMRLLLVEFELSTLTAEGKEFNK